MIRRTICFSLFFIITLFVKVDAQRSEVGFGLGTFNYTGDLAPRYHFGNSRPAATVFYRSNMSKVISFRAALTGGKVAGKDRGYDAFSETRDASFDIFLTEASAGFEYHFLNWRDEKRMLRFTPYMFSGLALFSMSGNSQNKPEAYSNIQVGIPIAVGVKYVINPLWYLSLEAGIRKTFFDYIDNTSVGDRRRKNFRYGQPFDNDNYYFVGITLTRTFYTIPCPTNPYK